MHWHAAMTVAGTLCPAVLQASGTSMNGPWARSLPEHMVRTGKAGVREPRGLEAPWGVLRG